MGQLRVDIHSTSAWHFALLACILLASVVLYGCHRHSTSLPIEDNNYKLPRKVPYTSDAKVIHMMRALNRAKIVKVTSIGSDYLISIPSSVLFPNQSPQLSWASYTLLNNVASFMKQFRKVGVTVTGYSSKYVSVKREQALTLARAVAVANYLWTQGIDSRFIFTEGAGSDKPITVYTEGGDNSSSSRIEITFRDTIV